VYTVLVSYLEIYNEQVYDLLAPPAHGRAGGADMVAVREPLLIRDGQ
jgi:hypothetical protein